ncbi:MAG: DnaJ domain-containing protein [Bryobacteraceae bacterium]
MDYYEELGVPRSASQDEIRRAWKRLARLFHPDLQTDPEMRETAELQMRRLNHILSVLTQSRERAQYDLMVDSEQSAPVRWDERLVRRHLFRELFRFDRKAAVWLACGVLISGILAAILLANLHDGYTADRAGNADVAVATAPPSPDATASLESRIDQFRQKFPPPEPSPVRATVAAKRDRGMVQTPPAPAKPDVAPASKSVSSEARPENRASEQRQAPAALPPPVARPAGQADLARAAEPAPSSPTPRPPEVMWPVRAASGLAGLWRYNPSKQTAQKPGLYAAEHVEVGISEESGVLYGYYTAHYLVPDGGVSPDVAFKFSGESGRDAATGTWSGMNGNRGEIRLRALSNNALEVVWVTTHMAHANSLASGKVTLSRAN